MFRSLFIGFLILSALASQGAGVQINLNTAISADILLNLYNAAVANADKQAGFADAKNSGTLTGSGKESAFEIRELLRSSGHDGPVVWALPEYRDYCGDSSPAAAVAQINQSGSGEIHSKGSDSSPPCGSDQGCC